MKMNFPSPKTMFLLVAVSGSFALTSCKSSLDCVARSSVRAVNRDVDSIEKVASVKKKTDKSSKGQKKVSSSKK